MSNRNVVVTSISIPKSLLGRISKRIKALKSTHEVKSVSDYYVKLAYLDIENANKSPASKPPNATL